MKLLSKLRACVAALLVFCISFFLTGCFQVEQLIKLKPDGSGTVEVTVVMTKQALEMMKEMSKGSPNEGKSPVDEMMSETKAKEQAAKLGEGVTFQKVEKVTNAIGEGARMTFTFKDITKLKPNLDLQNMGNGPEGSEAPVAFTFTPGSPAKLVVKTAHPKSGPKGEKPEVNPAEFQQAAQMMKGMKLTMAVEVQGAITQSDAAHQAGSRITFAEIPFDEILKNQATFSAMNKADGWADAVKVLKEVPGVKVEPKETVTVQFK